MKRHSTTQLTDGWYVTEYEGSGLPSVVAGPYKTEGAAARMARDYDDPQSYSQMVAAAQVAPYGASGASDEDDGDE